MEPYDPVRDGFPNSRLLMVVSEIARTAAAKSSELAYGTWNPQFCSAEAADELLDFCGSLRRYMSHFERQARKAVAAQGIDAQSAMTEGHGPKDESPVTK